MDWHFHNQSINQSVSRSVSESLQDSKHRCVSTRESVDQILKCEHHREALHFSMVLPIMLYKMVVPFDSG